MGAEHSQDGQGQEKQLRVSVSISISAQGIVGVIQG